RGMTGKIQRKLISMRWFHSVSASRSGPPIGTPHDMRFPNRTRMHLLTVNCIVAALACGCGLSEYESLMANSQERVRRFEEENKNLDARIKWPKKKKNEKNYVAVFFRPPKGISLTPNPNKNGSLYVYPRTASSGPIQEIWLGASTQAKFAEE